MNQAETVIRKEIIVLNHLNELADQKKQALFDNNMEALSQIVQEEEVAVGELKQLEDSRLRQAGLFSNSNLKGEIRSLLYELKTKNEFNQVVLRDAIASTRFAIQLMIGDESSSAVYGSEGRVEEKPYRQFFDGRG
jgi:flagellar biosynthesis/type III secretory pathway chaperone